MGFICKREKLVRPILTGKSVIVQNNLTIEIKDKEYNKCKNVMDLKVCTNLPNILHNPDNNECIISKVVLKRPINEIRKSCKWENDTTCEARVTRITDNEFVIANKKASVVLINCEKGK